MIHFRSISSGLLLLSSLFVSAVGGYRQFSVQQGLPNRQVQQVIELPNGQILVSNEGMFSLFNGRDFRIIPCDMDSVRTLPHFGCHSHLWQGDSLLWLKDFYHVYIFDAKRRRFIYDYDLADNSVRRFVDKDGDQQIAENSGQIDTVRPLFSQLTENTPIGRDRPTSYCCDRQGGQWFATEFNGLLYLPPTTAWMHLITLDNGDVVRRMTALDSHRLLVAGESGIYLFDRKQQAVVTTLATGAIHCAEIKREDDGRIWISTKQGLYCYQNGELTLYDEKNTKGLIHNHMRFALDIDRQRTLVCNLIHHLGYLDTNSRQLHALTEKIPALKQYRTMITAQHLVNDTGRVAICTQNGFFILNTRCDSVELLPSVERWSKFSSKFNCMLQDDAGRLWLGTQNGLIICGKQSSTRLTVDDGLSNSCIQSMTKDHKGRVWIGTANGINTVTSQNDSTFTIHQYGNADGVPDVEMTERGVCMTDDGTLYWATPAGMLTFSTEGTEPAQTALPVVLTSLYISGRSMPLDESLIVLGHKYGDLRMDFSALNYATPDYTRYRYRLRGLEDKWHYDYGSGNFLTLQYLALPPGSYTIEVQAAVNDSEWGTRYERDIRVDPPLWLTWWAKLLFLTSILLGVFFTLQLYLNRSRKKMEQENAERVNRLFELREEARQKFAESVHINVEKIAINMEEEELMKKMLLAINEHMDDCDYTVDSLASDIAMSRASLYRRLQTMLGITPNDFMRNVRLKRAAELLSETKLPVKQIAPMVGFLTPRYFSQCFQNVFGISPLEYRANCSTQNITQYT